MVQIIVYIVLAGIAFAAIHTFDLSRQKIGADAQLKADAPIINACKTDRDTATKANVSLQTDLQRLAGERETQNAAVADYAKTMARLQQEKDTRIASQAARLKAYDDDAAALRVRLAATTKGATCEQILSSVDRDLRDLASQRMRDTGTQADSDSRGAKPPPGVDSGKGSLRLSK